MTNLELILKRFFEKYRKRHPSLTLVDLDSATGADYDLKSEYKHIVLTDNYSTPWDFNLPAATGSECVIAISNQHTAAVSVNPNGTDTINGVNAAESIAAKSAMLFVDYTDGKWAAVLGGASSQPLDIYIPMAGAPTAVSVDVVWATNKPASTIVYYKRTADANWILAYDSGAVYTEYHEYTITGLLVETEYDIKVQSTIASPAELVYEYLYSAFWTSNRIGVLLVNLAIAVLSDTHHTPSTGAFAWTASDVLTMLCEQINNDYPVSNIAIAQTASSVHTPDSETPVVTQGLTTVVVTAVP